ncbi:MAG: MOSC domain-containing protein [Chloroflexi bacterium]|nr:MOSC domain-containing protein [Chloroflexota bacterium]
MIQVSSLTYYPIKACRGFDINSSLIQRMGLEHDRRMMVVTPEGEFLTQREYPKLALITPALTDGVVTLSAPEWEAVTFPVLKTGETIPVDVWRSKGVQAVDQGEAAAQWLSTWIGDPVRLVHIAGGFKRKLNPDYAVNADDHTGFADGYPILIASEESLQDLNSRLDSKVPMNRFRPNIVVKGCEPFAEDTWKRIKIGGVELAIVKPCARCVVTTIDKETLVQSKEPLKTLNTFRKQARAEQGRSVGGAMFGQNVIPLNEGRIEAGMSVQVVE